MSSSRRIQAAYSSSGRASPNGTARFRCATWLRCSTRRVRRDQGRRPVRGGKVNMSIADDLRRVVTSSRVLDAPAELRTYAYDASFLTQLAPRAPHAVVIAATTEDVSAVMRYANAHGVPVGPRAEER